MCDNKNDDNEKWLDVKDDNMSTDTVERIRAETVRRMVKMHDVYWCYGENENDEDNTLFDWYCSGWRQLLKQQEIKQGSGYSFWSICRAISFPQWNVNLTNKLFKIKRFLPFLTYQKVGLGYQLGRNEILCFTSRHVLNFPYRNNELFTFSIQPYMKWPDFNEGIEIRSGVIEFVPGLFYSL